MSHRCRSLRLCGAGRALPSSSRSGNLSISALQPQPFDPDRPEARSLFGSKPKNDSRPRRLPTAPVDVPVETEVVSAVVEAEPVADTRADASKETRAAQ
ncbi:MAG: hypothetical protein ACK5L2_19470 [Planctomyces sp.]